MKIAELFRRDIHRTIEEVVKVDLADEAVIADELDEYVATDHILDDFEKVLDAYQESITNPNETCTIWTSGFFGSGKSSWAKVLGYLLWNPSIQGRPASDRFFERIHAPRLKALLSTIHSQAPTLSVLLSLATGSSVVAREGESVVLPAYRALLERLGYSRNLLLAELEFTLETDRLLGRFETVFEEISGESWTDRRYTHLAKRQAIEALDAVYGDSKGLPRWARELDVPAIDADWFAARALELLDRRGGGARRLMFVVDEAGQYVARSVQRMLDLQGLAEAFQKHKGPLWLTVTSQERLNDVVDSLESKQVELARAQARFPLRVDLVPSDIDEVTGKRVLDKTDEGQRAVRSQLAPHRQKLAANTRLTSPTRAAEPAEDELVRLYPLLPYQVELLIDAVSVRRAEVGAGPTVGGSNRTLIKHAQQLIIHPQHGLANEDVGALVTLDRSYQLLEELIPTSWRAEVDQVAEQYGSDSLEAKTIRVVALCVDVPAMPLTVANIATLLHPGIAAEHLGDAVGEAVGRLASDDRLRETADGYKLQSPEQKNWERDRRAIDLTRGPSVRLRRLLIKEALTGLRVTKGRAFNLDVSVEGERVVSGELPLQIEEADVSRRETLRAASREAANEHRITWVYDLSPDTWDALLELHRTRTIIERRDTSNKTSAEVELVGEERERERRFEATALERLTRDLANGQVIFRGRTDDVDGVGDLAATAEGLLRERIDEIYPQLDQFTAPIRRNDVIHILRTADLGSLPGSVRDDGIGLVRATPSGYEVVTDAGPLAALAAEIRARASYGQEATGAYLASHFAAPPYGAPVEVVQALCAAGLRAGLFEVIHQGQRIANPSDARLDQVFGALPRFKAAAFRPPADTDVSLERRTDLAEKIEHLTGHGLAGHSTDILARSVRTTFLPVREHIIRIEWALKGVDVGVPEVVTRTREIVDRLQTDDDVEVVTTAHDTWADLVAGRRAVIDLDQLVTEHLDDIQAAQREAGRSPVDLGDELAVEHKELVDLLASGDLVDHVARTTAITHRLAEARHALTREAAGRLRALLDERRGELREEYGDLDDAALTEALRPLDVLAPPDDLTAVDATELETRTDSAATRANTAARQLEELRAGGRLAWVRISDLVSDPITSEEELDPVLDRIREAVATELADGKHVRLQ